MSNGATDHLERIESLERWKVEIDRKFAEAFPGGDHVSHARYHDLVIERTEEIRRLRRAVLEKTISGLVWGMLIGLGIAVWQYIKSLAKGA